MCDLTVCGLFLTFNIYKYNSNIHKVEQNSKMEAGNFKSSYFNSMQTRSKRSSGCCQIEFYSRFRRLYAETQNSQSIAMLAVITPHKSTIKHESTCFTVRIMLRSGVQVL